MNRDLGIIGSDRNLTRIVSPVNLEDKFGATSNEKPIIFVDNAILNIENLTIDGLGRGNNNSRFYGIAYVESDGIVNNLSVIMGQQSYKKH